MKFAMRDHFLFIERKLWQGFQQALVTLVPGYPMYPRCSASYKDRKQAASLEVYNSALGYVFIDREVRDLKVWAHLLWEKTWAGSTLPLDFVCAKIEKYVQLAQPRMNPVLGWPIAY